MKLPNIDIQCFHVRCQIFEKIESLKYLKIDSCSGVTLISNKINFKYFLGGSFIAGKNALEDLFHYHRKHRAMLKLFERDQDHV